MSAPDFIGIEMTVGRIKGSSIAGWNWLNLPAAWVAREWRGCRDVVAFVCVELIIAPNPAHWSPSARCIFVPVALLYGCDKDGVYSSYCTRICVTVGVSLFGEFSGLYRPSASWTEMFLRQFCCSVSIKPPCSRIIS